jgi:hypothetical protein
MQPQQEGKIHRSHRHLGRWGSFQQTTQCGRLKLHWELVGSERLKEFVGNLEVTILESGKTTCSNTQHPPICCQCRLRRVVAKLYNESLEVSV